MKYTFLSILIMISTCAGSAFAADITGNVELGGQYLDVRGDKAKFNEYRDIDSGAFGQLNLDISLKNYYLTLDGQNIGWNYNKQAGLDTQQYTLKGGMYDQFKYSLFYDETPHNITFGAKSAYSGIGSNGLTNDVSNLTLPLNSFDYGTKRTTYGGSFEGSFNTPFFFGVKVDRSEVKGILPAGFSPFSGESALELPAPIDYSTDNLYLETGYRSRNVILRVDGTLSEFENHKGPWLFFQQPPALAVNLVPGISTLPPDNSYYKIGGSLMVRLPVNSSFVVRGSYARLENSQNLFETGQSFQGDVHYSSVSTALTSNPVTPLNLRLFYNFLKRENESTQLGVYSLPLFGGTESPTRFDYRKQEAGIDLGYRLPARTKADAGYEYQQANRTREDGIETRDHIVFAQIKNSFFDWLSAKVRYQHMIRNSDTVSPAIANDPFFIDNFRRIDVADKTQDSVKVDFDFQPLDNLGFGIQYKFKQNDYDNGLLDTNLNRKDPTSTLNSLLGVQNDTRHEIYVNANYAISVLKLNGFFDLEMVERTMKAHEIDLGLFDWSSRRKDTSYSYGLNADVDIIKDVLTACAGWRYEKAYGTNDFTVSSVTLAPPVPTQSVGALDNFIRQTLTVKFGYHVTKQLLMDFGYMYERLKYEDDAWSGYQLANVGGAGGGGPGVFLTGAYANPNYEAHLGFVKFAYKF